MRLQTINEASSDERQQLVRQLNKLAKEAELAAVDELHTLLKDPVGMVRHTLSGIKARSTLLDDETWWHQMFEYWDHLDSRDLMKIHEGVFTDVVQRIEQAVEAGVVIEAADRKGGGFLSILSQFATLFLMFAFGSSTLFGKGKKLKQKSQKKQKKKQKSQKKHAAEIEAPSRDDLPPTSASMAKTEQTFEMRRLNPYIVCQFVEGCVKATKNLIDKGELNPFDDPSAPGDLGAERPESGPPASEPFNSGENITYPDPDEL
jgi:hypothetical protein